MMNGNMMKPQINGNTLALNPNAGSKTQKTSIIGSTFAKKNGENLQSLTDTNDEFAHLIIYF